MDPYSDWGSPERRQCMGRNLWKGRQTAESRETKEQALRLLACFSDSRWFAWLSVRWDSGSLARPTERDLRTESYHWQQEIKSTQELHSFTQIILLGSFLVFTLIGL